MPQKNRLIIFTKYPTPGRAKTRLIPALGREKAAAVHRQMTEHTLSIANLLAFEGKVSLEIFYEGGDLAAMQDWLGAIDFSRQTQGDLGEKMLAAFEQGFSDSAHKVVIIGTDCPNLTSDLLEEAFVRLNKHELVIGPASDGGYYLIGLRKRAGFLFRGISWGSEKVFGQTQEKAREQGLDMAVLKTLSDVDRPEDLQRLAPQNRCCP